MAWQTMETPGVLPPDNTNNNSSEGENQHLLQLSEVAVDDDDVAMSGMEAPFRSNDDGNDDPHAIAATLNSRITASRETVARVTSERLAHGRCPSCGIPLFRMPKRSFFFWNTKHSPSNDQQQPLHSSIKRPTPLSVKDKVIRGQCVRCSSATIHLERETAPSLYSSAAFAASTASREAFSASLLPGTAAGGAVPLKAVYTGPVNHANQPHGSCGTLRWSNGDVYVGQFRNGVRDGNGTLQFAIDGTEYVGEWKANQMNGHGTRRYVNGNVYSGMYRNNQRHGRGRCYFANGDMYHGEWHDNAMHGPSGHYYYNSGNSYHGDFAHDRRHGIGKYVWTDQSVVISRYESDKSVGIGVRFSKPEDQKCWKVVDGKCKRRIPMEQGSQIMSNLFPTNGSSTNTATNNNNTATIPSTVPTPPFV